MPQKWCAPKYVTAGENGARQVWGEGERSASNYGFASTMLNVYEISGSSIKPGWPLVHFSPIWMASKFGQWLILYASSHLPKYVFITTMKVQRILSIYYDIPTPPNLKRCDTDIWIPSYMIFDTHNNKGAAFYNTSEVLPPTFLFLVIMYMENQSKLRDLIIIDQK